MKKFIRFLLFFGICFNLDSDENHSSHLDTIVLGSGCFWGAEKGYEALNGVEDAVSGYSDGYNIEPS